MLMYDVIVVGFGKAGKTLAAKLSSQGKKVALIEKSKSDGRNYQCKKRSRHDFT